VRISLLILFLSGLAFGQAGGIQGVVVDSVTRAPMAGVHLTFMLVPDLNVNVEDAYGAISRQDGKFSIDGMKPGNYSVIARRNGWVQVPAQDATAAASFLATLKQGEQLTGYTVEMLARALITGRVTDEFGDPVKGYQVQATQTLPNGRVRTMSGFTDERGQYRMTGAPGQYRLKAELMQGNQNFGAMPEVRSDGSQPAVYAVTWFPSAESEDRAWTVDVGAGRDSQGIDIHLLRTRSLTISGTVTGMLEKGDRPFLYLFPADAGAQTQFQKVRNASASPDGKFSFTGVVPGSYRIMAQVFGNNAVRGQFVDVRVEGGDVTGLTLPLFAPEPLTGKLEILNDGTAGATTERPVVVLEGVSQYEKAFGGATGTGEPDAQGAFHIAKVFPGRLRVRVEPLPENAYVKSVKLDGTEAADHVVDLSRGVKNSSLRVVVSRKGATVEGSVVDEDGKPPQAPSLWVVLAMSPDELAFDSPGVKRAEGSSFSFKGLRPGKYRLYALNPYVGGNMMDQMAAGFAKGAEVTIREGEHVQHEAKVVARETSIAH
jgi:hypothetical protein